MIMLFATGFSVLGAVWEETNPIVWQRDDTRTVFGTKRLYRINYLFTSPCVAMESKVSGYIYAACHNLYYQGPDSYYNLMDRFVRAEPPKNVTLHQKRQLGLAVTAISSLTVFSNLIDRYHTHQEMKNLKEDVTIVIRYASLLRYK